jgi:hypothetical protein
MKILFAALVAAALLCAADSKLGKPLALKGPVTVDAVLANPAQYVGKTVQVKGKITAVCQMAGCWMDLVGEKGKTIRIKVNDGEIEFPKDGAGRMAIAEGKLVKIEMTREQAAEQAKHEAQEAGKPFDPASVSGPAVRYQIQGSGAVIVQ